MTPREVADLTARDGSTKDPLGMDSTRALARQIQETVRDPQMHPSIAMKVARAVTERKMNPSELIEILDCICSVRAAGGIKKSTGAYFVTSIKRAFQRNEIPW